MCPCCFLTHTAYTQRDPKLLSMAEMVFLERASRLPGTVTLEEGAQHEVNDPPPPTTGRGHGTPVASLVRILGPIFDISHNCIQCGKHVERGRGCDSLSRYGKGKGACLSMAVVCGACLPRGAGNLRVECPPRRSLLVPPQRGPRALKAYAMIGKQVYTLIPPHGFKSDGHGGPADITVGDTRIFLNFNRALLNRSLDDFRNLAEEEYRVMVGQMVVRERSKYQGDQEALPTKEAWATMVSTVDAAVRQAGKWSARQAYATLKGETQAQSLVLQYHELYVEFLWILNTCRSSGCPMLGLGTDINTTLTAAVYFKASMPA